MEVISELVSKRKECTGGGGGGGGSISRETVLCRESESWKNPEHLQHNKNSRVGGPWSQIVKDGHIRPVALVLSGCSGFK